MERMLEQYKKKAVPAMKKEFGYDNALAVPRIRKAVVNVGIAKMVAQGKDDKALEAIQSDVAAICGQHPVVTRAKKSIAGFKLRQGMIAGYKCTLRGRRMYLFLERLVHVALPRSRDFRGISKTTIEKGTITIAIKEHIVFPEVVTEKTNQIFGFEITVVTDAKTREETEFLLRQLGFPIKVK